MAKKVLALVLAFIMLSSALVGCGKKDDDDVGAYIQMYLTDMVYDLDPANAYENESNLKVISLLYDNLFILDEKGNVKKSLAKSYKIEEDDVLKEYKMIIELKDGAYWTDGVALSADDVVFSWKRALTVENSYEVASLLYDVKNARAVKEGDATIDDLGVYALNNKSIEIVFEEKIDYDHFLINLTSYALVPLRETVVTKTDDWAKKPATIVTSGPFRLREVSYDPADAHMWLERNPYYFRDAKEDPIDKSVTPYRLMIDYTMTDEQIKQAYDAGQLFYVGEIPLSIRSSYKDTAKVTDAISTHSYIFNENVVVRKYNAADFEKLSKNEAPCYDETLGTKLFADENVRKALSLAIDRKAIAEAVVFAEAATGLVPYGVFEADSVKKSFREVGGDILSASADVAAAKALLTNINPSDYMFAITVAAYDEVHMLIAEMVKTAWEALGFHVAINAVNVITNDDIHPSTEEVAQDIKDDIFLEQYKAGQFEVVAVDYTAFVPTAYSMLARFAKAFSGQGMDMSTLDYQLTPHISGYDNDEFNAKMEEIYAEKDIKKKEVLVHEAEKILLDDMPIIPIIFNKTATLTSKQLKNVDATYYCPAIFTKTKLKDYQNYIPESAK